MSASGKRRGIWSRLRGKDAGESGPAGQSVGQPAGEPVAAAEEWTRFVPVGPLNAQPDGFVLPISLRLDASQEQWLRAALWSEVVLGRTEADDALDLLQDELDEHGVSDEQADEAFRAVLRARREQQAGWPDDVARTPLMDAFAELEQIGVLGRADFSCCGTCASAEIADERDESRTWRGYVWFHQQDTESLLEDRSTYLGYGAFLDAYLAEEEWLALDDAAKDSTYLSIVTALMRDEVFPVLRRHGLGVQWDGDLGRRILLEDVDHYVAV